MIKPENYFLDNIINSTNIFLVILSTFLIILSYYNFLLFHSLMELFAVLVSFTIFMIAIYSHAKIENNFLVILAIAYGFIGAFDLLHTLAYKEMGVFNTDSADLPTQLWIIARYLESAAFLIAISFMNYRKKCDVEKILKVLSVLSILILLSLFFNIFPTSYLEGQGLTPFKIISEYIISGILLLSSYLLYKKKKHFKKTIYNLVFASIILTIFSEISFTFYIDVFDLSNITGHIFKLFSVILIFKAVIVLGFKNPYDLLYRELNLQKESEKEKKEFIESIYNNIEQGICVHELVYAENNEAENYRIIDTNQAYEAILEIPAKKAVGSLATDLYKTEKAPYLDTYLKVVETAQPITFEEYYQPMDKFFRITVTSFSDKEFITLFNDITEAKEREMELENQYQEIDRLSEKFESIIYLTERLSFTSKYSLEDFLKEVLDISMELVKEANFGSVSIFEDGDWKVIDNRAYNKEVVNELNYKRDFLFKSADNIFENELINVNNNDLTKYFKTDDIPAEIEEHINTISKYIKCSIFFDIEYERDKKLRLSLDTAADNKKEFDQNHKKLLKAFRNMIYVFIKEYKESNSRAEEQRQLFED